MNLFVSKLISGVLQILLFSAIPFIWWCFTKREQSFPAWVGLKKMDREKRTEMTLWVMGVTFVFCLLGVYIFHMMKGAPMAVSEFEGRGFSAVPAILIYAIFSTAFSEELFFRGFLLKRVANRFGFAAGNAVQAILFGVLHGFFFFSAIGPVKALIILVFTMIIAALMGYINEKKAAGSIFPSWIIHAASNLFAALTVAFSLL